MKVLITGANGQLGRELSKELTCQSSPSASGEEQDFTKMVKASGEPGRASKMKQLMQHVKL